MNASLTLRAVGMLLLSALCCSCSTPEERAEAAFAELQGMVQYIGRSLATVVDDASAEAAAPVLEEQAEDLRDALNTIDGLADDPDLPQEARRRLGERYHEPLRTLTDAALREVYRVGKRDFYHSDRLRNLARREFAHYSVKGVHPWPRAVLAGRQYRPKPPREQ